VRDVVGSNAYDWISECYRLEAIPLITRHCTQLNYYATVVSLFQVLVHQFSIVLA